MLDRSHTGFGTTRSAGVTALRQPVSLEVPVRVQGGSAELSSFFEDTNTVLVFPEGAVLRLAGQLNPGQSILLTNRATRQQMPCRVAYVRQQRGVRGYAEVEFARPAPSFWDETAGSVAEHTFSPTFGAMDATEVSLSAASLFPLTSPAETVQVAESFAKIDNIAEPVEPPPNFYGSFAEPEDDFPAPVIAGPSSTNVVNLPAPKLIFPAPPAVDEIEKLLAASRVETESQATARAADQFVTHVFNPAGQVAFVAPARPHRRRWMIAAIAAALLLTIGTSLGSWGLQAEVAHLQPPVPLPPDPPAWMLVRATVPPASLAGIPLRTSRMRIVFTALQPESLRRSADMRRVMAAATISASPRVARRADLGDVAIPEVASQEPAAAPQLTLVSTSTPFVPAPAATVESKLTPLRLVSSTRPLYPPMARRQRVQGEVLLHVLVDQAGKVQEMRVLSGPPALHDAAREALQQWKYEPAMLNGKPVAMHTTVSIKFQL